MNVIPLLPITIPSVKSVVKVHVFVADSQVPIVEQSPPVESSLICHPLSPSVPAMVGVITGGIVSGSGGGIEPFCKTHG